MNLSAFIFVAVILACGLTEAVDLLKLRSRSARNAFFTSPQSTLKKTLFQDPQLRKRMDRHSDIPTVNAIANGYYGGGALPMPTTTTPAPYCDGGPRETTGLKFLLTEWFGNNTARDKTLCTANTGASFRGDKSVTLIVGQSHCVWYWSGDCDSEGHHSFYTGSAWATAWVDWNQNGVWEDEEQLFPPKRLEAGDEDDIFIFETPLTAKLGPTRARVQIQQKDNAEGIDACDTFDYGEVRDYPVIVAPGICPTGGPTSPEDAEILSVDLVGEFDLNIHDTESCPGSVGVTDDYAKFFAPSLFPGGKYYLNFNAGTCGDVYDVIHTAWADWNWNNIFEDEEQLFPISSQKGNNAREFVVPTDAAMGQTRLRLQLKEPGDDVEHELYHQSPCEDFEYGDTHDYAVFVHWMTEIHHYENGYCSSGGPLLPDDGEFLGVSISGEDGTSIEDNDGCEFAGTGVKDETDKNVHLSPGKTYTIHYNRGTCGDWYEALQTAWIDWNQNKKWEPTEQLFPSSEAENETSHDFTVPADAILGATRMRIQLVELDFWGRSFIQEPCEDNGWGDTRDYTVTVVLAANSTPANPGGLDGVGGVEPNQPPPEKQPAAIHTADLTGKWNTGSHGEVEIVQDGDNLTFKIANLPDSFGQWIDSTTIQIILTEEHSGGDGTTVNKLTATVTENGTKLQWQGLGVWTKL